MSGMRTQVLPLIVIDSPPSAKVMDAVVTLAEAVVLAISKKKPACTCTYYALLAPVRYL